MKGTDPIRVESTTGAMAVVTGAASLRLMVIALDRNQ